tara:strand:- start:1556 stop:2419 length:864 start_codon:yes stop_codon:yes gene_type:complete
MQANKNRRYVYLFISAGVLSLVFSISFALYQSNFFAKRSYYTFVTNSAAGLSSRPIVSLKGVEIGRVTNFELGENIKVSLYLLDEFKKFLSGREVLSFKRNPLTGDIIEIELVTVSNPDDIYPGGFNTVFQTTNGALKNTILLEGGAQSKGVDQLVSSVSNLVSDIESKKIIEKLNLTLDNTNQFGEKIKGLILENPEKFRELSSNLLTSLSEVNSLIKGMNTTNKALYSVLKEVDKNKSKIGGILNHGEATLIQGQHLIEGVKENSLLSPLISKEPKDLKKNVFME